MSDQTQTQTKISARADTKRRLLAGETLTSAQIADDYNVGTSFLGGSVKEIIAEHGIGSIVTEPLPGNGNPKAYRVREGLVAARGGVNREAWGPTPGVTSNRKKAPAKATEPKEPKLRKRKGLDHPVPALGGTHTVFMLTVNNDGLVAVGFKDESGQSWVAEITAYAKAAT